MNLLFKCFKRRNWLIGSIALLMSLGWSQAVRAEGSRDLTGLATNPTNGNGGYRPFLEWRTDNDLTGIRRRNEIYVYAEAGETINLASSAYRLNTSTIRYTPPSSNTAVNCPVPTAANQFAGRIPNLAAEIAGSGNGYTPCSVTVGGNQTGVWKIEFLSPTIGTTDPPNTRRVNEEWGVTDGSGAFIGQSDTYSAVAAWDVTVRSSSNDIIPGRVYANYLPLNMGGNGITLNSTTYVLTKEGYTYKVELKGLDPYGFVFFANNKGFTDASGNPRYRSIQNSELPPTNTPVPSRLHSPTDPDTATDITHKIFFNEPSSTLPISDQPSPNGSTWLRRDNPIDIPTISNFQFTGVDGTPNQAGPTVDGLSKGGNFTFSVQGTDSSGPRNTVGGFGHYVIAIDVNGDGDYGNDSDRVLTGPAKEGDNIIYWDGQNSQGEPLPAQSTGYKAKLNFFIGDVHFPFSDPENNPGGLTIERLNSVPVERTIYYNDSTLPQTGGPTNPLSALDGVDSSSGVHIFGNGTQQGFGNTNGIDTWTSLVSPITLIGDILIKIVDLQAVKTVDPTSLAAGEALTYTITITNSGLPIPPNFLGPFSDVQGARVTDTVPSELTGIRWTCSITTDVAGSVTNQCNTTSGTGNNIDLTVDLNVGATATITVTGAVSPITPQLTLNNEVNVSPPADVTEVSPGNNTYNAFVDVSPSPIAPAGVKSVSIFADNDNSGTPTTGDVVEYTITYANNSPNEITNVLATDPIESDKLDFVNGSYSLTASGAGTTITPNPNYNGTTDTNLNTIGTLGANGGRIDVTYRALIKAPAGTTISNQASATSSGGTVTPSKSFAITIPGSLPVEPIIPGNPQPTIINVGGNTAGSSLRLLKRITNITRGGVRIDGINFDAFTDDPNDNNDTAPGWSQLSGSSPVGVFDIGTEASLQSGDDVEYTVYFLSDGTQAAQAIKVCDPIPEGTLYIPGSISLTLPSAGLAIQPQTDALNDDRGSFIPSLNVSSPFSAPPCPNPNNPTGAVFVDLGDIPNTAPNNVGFVRFRVKIE